MSVHNESEVEIDNLITNLYKTSQTIYNNLLKYLMKINSKLNNNSSTELMEEYLKNDIFENEYTSQIKQIIIRDYSVSKQRILSDIIKILQKTMSKHQKCKVLLETIPKEEEETVKSIFNSEFESLKLKDNKMKLYYLNKISILIRNYENDYKDNNEKIESIENESEKTRFKQNLLENFIKNQVSIMNNKIYSEIYEKITVIKYINTTKYNRSLMKEFDKEITYKLSIIKKEINDYLIKDNEFYVISIEKLLFFMAFQMENGKITNVDIPKIDCQFDKEISFEDIENIKKFIDNKGNIHSSTILQALINTSLNDFSFIYRFIERRIENITNVKNVMNSKNVKFYIKQYDLYNFIKNSIEAKVDDEINKFKVGYSENQVMLMKRILINSECIINCNSKNVLNAFLAEYRRINNNIFE